MSGDETRCLGGCSQRVIEDLRPVADIGCGTELGIARALDEVSHEDDILPGNHHDDVGPGVCGTQMEHLEANTPQIQGFGEGEGLVRCRQLREPDGSRCIQHLGFRITEQVLVGNGCDLRHSGQTEPVVMMRMGDHHVADRNPDQVACSLQ